MVKQGIFLSPTLKKYIKNPEPGSLSLVSTPPAPGFLSPSSAVVAPNKQTPPFVVNCHFRHPLFIYSLNAIGQIIFRYRATFKG